MRSLRSAYTAVACGSQISHPERACEAAVGHSGLMPDWFLGTTRATAYVAGNIFVALAAFVMLAALPVAVLVGRKTRLGVWLFECSHSLTLWERVAPESYFEGSSRGSR